MVSLRTIFNANGLRKFMVKPQKKLPFDWRWGFSIIWKQIVGVQKDGALFVWNLCKMLWSSDHLIISDLSIRKHHHLVKENLVYIYKPSLYIIVTYFTIHSNHYNLVVYGFFTQLAYKMVITHLLRVSRMHPQYFPTQGRQCQRLNRATRNCGPANGKDNCKTWRIPLNMFEHVRTYHIWVS